MLDRYVLKVQIMIEKVEIYFIFDFVIILVEEES